MNYNRDRDLWSINNPRPRAVPSGSGGLWTINPCLLWFIYNIYVNYNCLHKQLGLVYMHYTGFELVDRNLKATLTKSTYKTDEKALH